jgi:cell division protein ZapA (FtsZ GTPase activity inhibitor)
MSAETRSSVTVRIMGEEHTIRSNAAPEYTEACARFVDERIQEIRERAAAIDGHRAVILAALSITDLYFQSREASRSLEEEVATSARRLSEKLDRILDG